LIARLRSDFGRPTDAKPAAHSRDHRNGRK
jgi:hypothetical protein